MKYEKSMFKSTILLVYESVGYYVELKKESIQPECR